MNTQKFEELPLTVDSQRIINASIDEVTSSFHEMLNLGGDPFHDEWFIAGGSPVSAINGKHAKDQDVYLTKPPSKELVNLLDGQSFKTGWSYTHNSWSGQIQVIHFMHGTPEEVVSSFDFAHCQMWIDPSSKKVFGTAEALECARCKILIYKGSRFPLKALMRVGKFLHRGWSIPQDSYDLLMSDMQAIKVDAVPSDSIDSIKSQLNSAES